ncbi:MAG: UvrD-helicase domain-containing protein [Bacteroidia bacterium]|nr:UvrD-helicase domain-containing protein [Bacteroidia bacterium]
MTEGKLTIVRSSAGSGKTYTLVLYYLRIALMKPESFNEILAITFTNKATQEMKARLIKALKSLSEGSEDKMAETLDSMTGLNSEEIKSRSRHLLQLILHRYSGLAVMTIDSFFYRLIRPVARELGISLNREIELDTGRVSTEVKQRLMLEAGADAETTLWLEQFINDKMSEKENWNIDREITKQVTEIINDSGEIFAENQKPVDFALVNELRKIRKQYQNRLKEISKKFFEVLQQHQLTATDLKGKDRGVANWFIKILNSDFKKENRNKTVDKCLENAEEWVTKTHERAELIQLLAEEHFIPLLNESVHFFEEGWEAYITATAVLEMIFVAGLAGKIKTKLAEYRDDEEILLLPDINRIIAGALSINDTNFVFEKTGNRFRHFLIDEFQDTSLIQWKNLLPLIENGLSSGGNVLIVGDAKQSIYRWRGGRMELLLKGINRQLDHYEEITDEKSLAVNYRSAPEIVELNNRFFTEVSKLRADLVSEQMDEFPLAYSDGKIEQEVREGNTMKGYAEIRLIKKNKDGDKKNKEDKRTELMTLMLERIRQALADGFTEKDMAILTREKKDATLIASFLFENGMTQVLSPESLRASSSDKVQLLIHSMKLLLADDDITRAACLYFFQRIHGHEISHNEIFGRVKMQDEFFKALPAEFLQEFHLLHTIPLADLAEHIIRIFKLPTDVFVLRFQDAILEFNSKDNGNLYDFIQWWEENEQQITITLPENANAIRIMTIHKSKGLQFPVVLIPFTDWQLKPKHESVIWTASDKVPFSEYGKFPVLMKSQLSNSYFKDDYQRELDLTMLDNINLLYVAFTRAEMRLHVFGFSDKPDYNTAAGMITTVMHRPEFANQLQNSDVELLLESGTLRKPEWVKDKAESLQLSDFISQPWRNRISLALNKNLISVNDEPGALQGLKFHQIMSEIIFEHEAEAIIKKYGTEAELKIVIENLLKQCREMQWFNGKYQIKTEQPLLLPDGAVLRPDRLMIDKNKITILDYKTGEPNEKHDEQLLSYAKVLTEAGYEVEGCFLYYTITSLLKKAG